MYILCQICEHEKTSLPDRHKQALWLTQYAFPTLLTCWQRIYMLHREGVSGVHSAATHVKVVHAVCI